MGSQQSTFNFWWIVLPNMVNSYVLRCADVANETPINAGDLRQHGSQSRRFATASVAQSDSGI
jgi:hypothetical protein